MATITYTVYLSDDTEQSGSVEVESTSVFDIYEQLKTLYNDDGLHGLNITAVE